MPIRKSFDNGCSDLYTGDIKFTKCGYLVKRPMKLSFFMKKLHMLWMLIFVACGNGYVRCTMEL